MLWLLSGVMFVPLKTLQSATDQESTFQMMVTANTERRENITSSHLKFHKVLFYSLHGWFSVVVVCVILSDG